MPLRNAGGKFLELFDSGLESLTAIGSSMRTQNFAMAGSLDSVSEGLLISNTPHVLRAGSDFYAEFAYFHLSAVNQVTLVAREDASGHVGKFAWQVFKVGVGSVQHLTTSWTPTSSGFQTKNFTISPVSDYTKCFVLCNFIGSWTRDSTGTDEGYISHALLTSNTNLAMKIYISSTGHSLPFAFQIYDPGG